MRVCAAALALAAVAYGTEPKPLQLGDRASLARLMAQQLSIVRFDRPGCDDCRRLASLWDMIAANLPPGAPGGPTAHALPKYAPPAMCCT